LQINKVLLSYSWLALCKLPKYIQLL